MEEGEEEEEEEGGGEKKKREIVGMIRGCIKTVTCGKKYPRPSNSKSTLYDYSKPLPVFTKLAYILGLRVSPSHRFVLFFFLLLLFLFLLFLDFGKIIDRVFVSCTFNPFYVVPYTLILCCFCFWSYATNNMIHISPLFNLRQ